MSFSRLFLPTEQLRFFSFQRIYERPWAEISEAPVYNISWRKLFYLDGSHYVEQTLRMTYGRGGKLEAKRAEAVICHISLFGLFSASFCCHSCFRTASYNNKKQQQKNPLMLMHLLVLCKVIIYISKTFFPFFSSFFFTF